jgi:hypothetical protein
MQQTAIDWLIEQINGHSLNNVTIDIPKEVIEEAKKIHWMQIIHAYTNGYIADELEFQTYYEKTYKKIK